MEDEVGLSDEVLISHYRKGDVKALAKLVERYKKRLFGFILHMAGRSDEADEIFQETWFRAIKNLDKYREKNLLAWLTRIAHNLLVDRWRSRKGILSLDAGDGEGGLDWSERLAAAGPDPSGMVDEADIATHIAAAIKGLPTEQKEVVLMRVKEGLSFKEIAAAQGVSINTALARMQYGLSKLRGALGKKYGAMIGERK